MGRICGGYYSYVKNDSEASSVLLGKNLGAFSIIYTLGFRAGRGCLCVFIYLGLNHSLIKGINIETE